MGDVQPRFGYPGLRISYTCAAAVTGGQLVERVAGTRLVQPAGAGSLVVAGVALWDVPAARSSIQGPQVGDGDELAVYTCGVIKVTAASAVTEGARLIAAANGQVAAAGATPDARTIIGWAFEAIGAGATGLIRINV